MKSKNLIFRYVFLFLMAVILTAILLNSYKNQRVAFELKNYSKSISKSYKNTYEQFEQIAELIFFNNILYDKKVIKFFKKQNKSKEELYYYLRNRFFYLKSYGLKDIHFYLPDNKLFLEMKNPENESYLSEKKSLKYVNKTLNDISLFEVNKKGMALKFIKPIFDNDLQHLGSIELSFSLDSFSSKMEEYLSSNVLFIYKKTDALLKEKEFNFFYLNKEFLVEKNKYNEFKYNMELFKEIKKSHENLKNYFYSKEKTVSRFLYKEKTYPFILMPLENKTIKNIYLFAYGINENSSLSLMIVNLKIVFIILCLMYIFIFIFLYKYSRSKMKLIASEKKYKDFLLAIDKYVIMVETNTKGIITNVTQPCCKISGYRKEEFLGKNINMLRHPDISPKFFEKMWQDLKELKIWEGEIKNKDKYGSSYWVKGAIFPKFDEFGEHIGFISIRANITDAVQLRKFNRLLKEDLSNKLNEIKMKDQDLVDNTKVSLIAKVLDTTSHQWKKPISEISIELAKLSAQSKKKIIEKDEIEDISFKISNYLKNLSMTLNEFKSFFSEDEQSDKYSVTLAIKEAISIIKSQVECKEITISLDYKKEIYCYGFFNELKYIIINLLKNSIEQLKHTNTNNPYIELSIIKDGNDTLIKYTDNAKEDSKKLINRIFSSEFKEDLNKNTGLNLYISKLLIEKSGAEIWFDENSKNTIFYIKLISKDRRELDRN